MNVQFSHSVMSDSVTPWAAAGQAFLSFTNSWSLLKLMSIELLMPSNHLILCHPLLLPPSILPSIRVFSNESALPIRWPKYWSFTLSISPCNKYSGLTSFRMDWLDLPAVQGTLKRVFSSTAFKSINCAVACTTCFYSNSKEGQCQRMFKLLHNCTPFTCCCCCCCCC